VAHLTLVVSPETAKDAMKSTVGILMNFIGGQIITKCDKHIVESFVKILRYYCHLGPVKLAELLRMAYEKEIGYAMHETRPRSRS
jgi:hypothetical protein